MSISATKSWIFKLHLLVAMIIFWSAVHRRFALFCFQNNHNMARMKRKLEHLVYLFKLISMRCIMGKIRKCTINLLLIIEIVCHQKRNLIELSLFGLYWAQGQNHLLLKTWWKDCIWQITFTSTVVTFINVNCIQTFL